MIFIIIAIIIVIGLVLLGRGYFSLLSDSLQQAETSDELTQIKNAVTIDVKDAIVGSPQAIRDYLSGASRGSPSLVSSSNLASRKLNTVGNINALIP